MQNDNRKKSGNPGAAPMLGVAAVAGGAGLIGYAIAKQQAADRQRSRAEIDDPDGVDDVCKEIDDLLRDLVMPLRASEEQYHSALFEYLDEHSEYEVEDRPAVAGKCPDILVGDALALEIKYNPSTAECDRLIGQAAKYSVEWATWIVLFDTPGSRVGQIRRLLADKGLDHILVWPFYGADVVDEDDDDSEEDDEAEEDDE